jgi:hypothetical protein
VVALEEAFLHPRIWDLYPESLRRKYQRASGAAHAGLGNAWYALRSHTQSKIGRALISALVK